MKPIHSVTQALALAGLLALAPAAHAYDSGSTGADGAFSPTVNTELQLPPSGVFNFTSVNIPTGVTVTFKKNATNTPVVILASGNVTVAGTINVSGSNAANTGAAGDGNIGDDGLPGVAGIGGYEGGNGGATANSGQAGNGLGPGGGRGAKRGSYAFGGGGGGFGSSGANNPSFSWGYSESNYGNVGYGGPAYGSSLLLPLIGGSGGGGGAGGTVFAGSGGGGGGGAILIASSGTVTVSGSLLANGGGSGSSAGDGAGGTGGGGSGGAIRIVATTITGNGTISAAGGGASSTSATSHYGGNGSSGRIRLEAETFTRTAASSPTHSFGTPSSTFVAGLPTLRITSVAGVTAPAEPTGNADVVLPSTTPNPVSVSFATTGVPVGNTVKLTVTPAYGTPASVISPALTGTTDAATASVSVDLPTGPSTLSATTTYTIVASLGDALSRFAEGERVEKVTLVAAPGQATKVILTTVSGKEFEAPHAALAVLGS